MKVNDKRTFWVRTTITLLTVVAGWAVFNLLRILFTTLLESIGIISEAAQMIVIIAFVILVFAVLGVSFRKSFKKIVGS